ncbi:hypothetical protein GOODEAATRI_004004, partial [Goodea atripinnis]
MSFNPETRRLSVGMDTGSICVLSALLSGTHYQAAVLAKVLRHLQEVHCADCLLAEWMMLDSHSLVEQHPPQSLAVTAHP